MEEQATNINTNTHNNYLVIISKYYKILLLILIIVLPLFGFYLGLNFNKNQTSNLDKINNLSANYEQKIKALEAENSAILHNAAQLLGTTSEKYDKKTMVIYSPLLDGKSVTVETFKFKGEIIKLKSVKIDENTNLDIWELPDNPNNQAIFNGYENYGLGARFLTDLEKDWSETYINKYNIKMYYSYDYSPKQISGVTLNIYQKTFPNYRIVGTKFIQLSYNSTDGWANSKTDPLVLEFKRKLNEIADTIEFTKIENK